jgi:hypothetical protein
VKHASRERASRKYVETFGVPGASDAWGGAGSSFGIPYITSFLTRWSDRIIVLYRQV